MYCQALRVAFSLKYFTLSRQFLYNILPLRTEKSSSLVSLILLTVMPVSVCLQSVNLIMPFYLKSLNFRGQVLVFGQSSRSLLPCFAQKFDNWYSVFTILRNHFTCEFKAQSYRILNFLILIDSRWLEISRQYI